MAKHYQTSFASGVLSPSLWGRVDVARYNGGLALGRNFFVHVHGGASNRPGQHFVGPVRDSSRRARAIEFLFGETDTYSLIFGHLTLRFERDGGLVLETPVNIENLTQTNPVRLSVTGHGWSENDDIFILDAGGMTELAGRYCKVGIVNANVVELYNESKQPIDGTGYSPWSSGGQVGHVYEIATPYTEDDLFFLKYAQTADVMTLSVTSHPVKNLTRNGHTSWTLTDYVTASKIPAPTGLATGGGTGSEWVVTALNTETGEESLVSANAVGGSLETAQTTLTWNAVVVSGVDIAYNVYARYTGGGVYGYVGRAPTNSYTYGSEQPLPDFQEVPPEAKTPFDDPADYPGANAYHDGRQVFGGLASAVQKFVGSGAGSYENFNRRQITISSDSYSFVLDARKVNPIRHILSLSKMILLTAGAEWVVNGADGNGGIVPTQPPNVRVRSENGCSHVTPIVINDTALYVQNEGNIVRDLAYTIDADDYTGTDVSIMSPDLFSGRVLVDSAYAQVPDRIAWYCNNAGELLSFTYMRENDLWAWSHHDTLHGRYESLCARPPTGEEGPARQRDVVTAIVQRDLGDRTVRYIEQFADRECKCPRSGNKDMRHAYFVDAGVTYDVPQAVTGLTSASPAVITVAGHGWSNGDEIDLEGVVGVSSWDGQARVDTLADLVNGELGRRRYRALNVTANTAELYLLDLDDDYNDVPLDTTGVSAYREGGTARKAVDVFSNLWHLEGQFVAVLGDANVVANAYNDPIPLQVTNGQITTPTKHSIAHIGLRIESALETLPLPIQLGARKAVGQLVLRLVETRGIWVGPDEQQLAEFRQRLDERWDEPVRPYTGDAIINITSEWDRFATLHVHQYDPLPVTVAGIYPDAEGGQGG